MRILCDVGLVLVGCLAVVLCVSGIVLAYPVLTVKRLLELFDSAQNG